MANYVFQWAESYRKLVLVSRLAFDGKRPPALDPLLFKQGHMGDVWVCQHVQGAELGRLGTSRKSIQIHGESP